MSRYSMVLKLAGMMALWLCAALSGKAQPGNTALTRLAPLTSPVPFDLNFQYMTVRVKLTNTSPFSTTYDRVSLVYRDTESVFALSKSTNMHLEQKVGNEHYYVAYVPIWASEVRILEKVNLEVTYCDPNYQQAGYSCLNFKYYESLRFGETDLLFRVRDITDPANCGNNPPNATGAFSSLADGNAHCTIINQVPTGNEIVFGAGLHVLNGEYLYGVEIKDDIRVMPGAQVFIDAENSVGLRGNIIVEPGGFMQVSANTIALDNSEEPSSVPTTELMVHSGAEFRAYADDLLYLTMDTHVYNGKLRLVGWSVKLYPRFTISDFIIANQGEVEIEFCEQLDLHHGFQVDASQLSIYSPNEEGSFIITYTPIIIDNQGHVDMKAGKVFSRGQMMVAGGGGFLTLETWASLIFEGVAPNDSHVVPDFDFGTMNSALGIGDAITLTEVGLYVYQTDIHSCPDSYDLVPVPQGQRSAFQEQEALVLEESLRVFPNPMRNHATVAFDLAEASPVRFVVYDLQGRVMYHSDTEYAQPGQHQWEWDVTTDAGEPLAAGTYQLVVQSREGLKSMPILVGQ